VGLRAMGPGGSGRDSGGWEIECDGDEGLNGLAKVRKRRMWMVKARRREGDEDGGKVGLILSSAEATSKRRFSSIFTSSLGREDFSGVPRFQKSKLGSSLCRTREGREIKLKVDAWTSPSPEWSTSFMPLEGLLLDYLDQLSLSPVISDEDHQRQHVFSSSLEMDAEVKLAISSSSAS